MIKNEKNKIQERMYEKEDAEALADALEDIRKKFETLKQGVDQIKDFMDYYESQQKSIKKIKKKKKNKQKKRVLK